MSDKFFTYAGNNIFLKEKQIQSKELNPGLYAARSTMSGDLYLQNKSLVTDKLIPFKNQITKEIDLQLENLWKGEEKYKQYGVTFKRGMLLYGRPGNGKSSYLYQMIDKYVKSGNIAFHLNASNIHVYPEIAKMIYSMEPSMKMLAVLEDLDEYYDSSYFLSLLEGENTATNTFFVATTNYKEKLPERFLRAGRLDVHIEIPNPDIETRALYLKNKLQDDDIKYLDEMVEKSEGLTMASLKELLLSVCIYGKTIDESVEILKKQVEV